MRSPAKSTRVNKAYERLKSDILNGDLPPAFQAPEPDIATRLQMSRTPVREALIRLEAEGLVELIPRRGARVFSITKQDFLEIQQILTTLEGLAVAIIARRKMSNESFDSLDSVVGAAEQALCRGDFEDYAKQDDLFRRRLGKLSSPRLQKEIDRYLNQIYRASRVLLKMNKAPATPPKVYRDLIGALLVGDPEAAEGIVKSQRLQALSTMECLFEECGLSHL